MLDFGFIWRDLFRFGLLLSTTVVYLAYFWIAAVHVLVTVTLAALKRHAAWFLLSAVLAALPMAVASSHSAVLPRFSELWRSGSSHQASVTEARDAARQRCERVSKSGLWTAICLFLVTGVGVAASTDLRIRARHRIAAAGGSALPTAHVQRGSAPGAASRIAQEIPATSRARCFAWIAASWFSLVIASIMLGFLLGWAGQNYQLQHAGFVVLPALGLLMTIAVIVLVCIWSVRFSHLAFGRGTILMAVALCVLQIMAALPVFLISLVVGYGMGGGRFQ